MREVGEGATALEAAAAVAGRAWAGRGRAAEREREEGVRAPAGVEAGMRDQTMGAGTRLAVWTTKRAPVPEAVLLAKAA